MAANQSRDRDCHKGARGAGSPAARGLPNLCQLGPAARLAVNRVELNGSASLAAPNCDDKAKASARLTVARLLAPGGGVVLACQRSPTTTTDPPGRPGRGRGAATLTASSKYSTVAGRLARPLVASACCLLLLLPLWLNFVACYRVAPARTKHRDESCSLPSKLGLSEAQRVLLVLECDVRPTLLLYQDLKRRMTEMGLPIVEQQQRQQPQQQPDRGLGQVLLMAQRPAEKSVDLDAEIPKLLERVVEFSREGLAVINMRDFCTYPTISRLGRLRELARGCELLELTYDLVAIEFHEACLNEAISRLPAVPYLVRDVVHIYMDGADKPALPDLNGDPMDESADGSQQAAADEQPFDIDLAIRQSGTLRDVVNLLIIMPGDAENRVEEFKQKCKQFLIEIEQRWQSMEMMNQMLATESNAIRRLNNYVVRKIAPTKYADICSQLSARAN